MGLDKQTFYHKIEIFFISLCTYVIGLHSLNMHAKLSSGARPKFRTELSSLSLVNAWVKVQNFQLPELLTFKF